MRSSLLTPLAHSCRSCRPTSPRLHWALNIGCWLSAALALPAQQTPASAPILVTDLPLDQTILPTARPLSSLLGTERNVLDTPRSVAAVTAALLDARQLDHVSELSQYAAGTYSPSIFGAEGVPTIRGVFSELYQNGQRLRYVVNGQPPSFNSVEALDIVKGPGSPAFGPSANGLGGYVNFVTKQPRFDKFSTSLMLRLGDLAADGQPYPALEWQADLGGPISPKLAWRLSYFGRESHSHYDNVKSHSQDLFLALAWLPSDSLRLDLTSQLVVSRFNENSGVNRVTQDLIDNHRYITGDILPGSGFAPWQGVIDPGPDGSYADQTRAITSRTGLVSPQDSAYGKHSITQLILSADLAPGLRLTHRQLLDWSQGRKFSTFGYNELSKLNLAYDTRTEIEWTPGQPAPEPLAAAPKNPLPLLPSPAAIRHRVLAGIAYRYEEAENYQDFSNEPFVAYDLLTPGGFRSYPRPVVFGGSGSRVIPGETSYSAGSFASQASATTLHQTGVFLQDEITFGPKWELILGLRADYLRAESHRPKLGPLVEDPASGDLPAGDYSAADSLNGAYFASLLHHPLPGLTLYATYNRVTAMQGNSTFGNPLVPVADLNLRDSSTLYETGLKVSALENTLYLALAAYHQTRVRHDLLGNASDVLSRGIEVECTYQPTPAFNATFNFTWARHTYQGINSLYAQTGRYEDAYTDAFRDTNGVTGTGFGSPNYDRFGANPLPRGDYDIPGIPQLLFNASATYRWPCGLAFTLGPQITGKNYANLPKTLRIPAQVTWNAALSYHYRNAEITLSAFNLTNEKNFTPPDAFAANDLIYLEKPLTANLTVKLDF